MKSKTTSLRQRGVVRLRGFALCERRLHRATARPSAIGYVAPSSAFAVLQTPRDRTRHVWEPRLRGRYRAIADIYGGASEGECSNINGLPIDDRPRHLWPSRSPMATTNARADTPRGAGVSYDGCYGRHGRRSASVVIYADAGDGERSNINGLLIDDRSRHLWRCGPLQRQPQRTGRVGRSVLASLTALMTASVTAQCCRKPGVVRRIAPRRCYAGRGRDLLGIAGDRGDAMATRRELGQDL